MKNKVLVIGGGGREHAIIHTIKKSPLLEEVFCIPGNAGIEDIATCYPDVSIVNHQEIIDFCKINKIDLVIVGPEQPLIEGLVDSLNEAQIKVFGPTKLAARLEGSKAFTKDICRDYKIPTAKYGVFDNQEEAINFIDQIGIPCVVKADGIAAGKGVIIALDKKTACDAIKDIFGGKFGEAGKNIVIEEFLEGVEVSFFAICDGSTAKFLGSAGDHKKVGEGETGLNTGGMGTYSPSPFVTKDFEKSIMKDVINPTLKAMSDLGCSFVGILFAGLITTKDGPQLLEFNTRFGDPETQSLLPRLQSALLELILESVAGKLENYGELKFSDKAAVCVVMAANGYPENYKKGSEIKNLEAAASAEGVIIFHAGSKKDGNRVLANGGRVLGVTAIADDIKMARDNAYEALDLVDWQDGFCRRDIALKVC
jgi:phosphoribosylamine--glycine ligase